MSVSKKNVIAILDAGAQYAKVIDRRIRELSVETEVLPLDVSFNKLKSYAAIIISGGPESVYSLSAPEFDKKIFQINKPILGICYGMQLMNYVHGGKVEKKNEREDGVFNIEIDAKSKLFAGLKPTQEVLLTHGDTVDAVPDGFKVTAMSGNLIAALEHSSMPWYGVQFHPEVDLTINGKKVLENFVLKIAKVEPTFTIDSRVADAVEDIKNRVGNGHVLVLVSGGVDSTVAAALVTKALGPDQVHALHIDTGFMRKDESENVEIALNKIGLKLHVVKAKEIFLNANTEYKGEQSKKLSEVVDPEEKRNIIGDTYIRVTEKKIKELRLPLDKTYLVQGTLRPDLIESASASVSKNAHTIKTHHNDTQLVRKLRNEGKVIEPLASYHKDEVREIGRQLGLPSDLVERHPFPGPGLAIRILCATEPFYDDKHDFIDKELQKFSTNSYHLALLPIRSVGVQGDGRTYSYVAAISGQISWEKAFDLAKEIPKVIHRVNRVVLLINHNKIDRIVKITPTLLNDESISQVREADHIVQTSLTNKGLNSVISQVPVVLIPVSFNSNPERSIVIRTLITKDFMTGIPARPGQHIKEELIEELATRIVREVKGISGVAYDLTAKPPGTTEWE